MIIREAISFERGHEPIRALGIGIFERIKSYAQQKIREKDYSWSSPSGWMWEIMEDKDLDEDTKILWTQFLKDNEEYLNLALDAPIKELQNFERGQDPKTAMGIGKMNQIKSWIKKNYGIIPSTDETTLHYAVLGNRMDFVKYLVEVKKIPILDKFINLAMTNNYDDLALYLLYPGDQKTIDYIKSKKKKSLKEAQQFQRGLEGNQALGIGLESIINDYMEENSPEQPDQWIYEILTSSQLELDDDTRQKWAQFLIQFPKYTKSFDENVYLELKEKNITWIPYVPIMGNDFKYKLAGERLWLNFTSWGDFAPLFENNREYSQEFIQSVLSGEDTYEYFNSGIEAYEDVTDGVQSIQFILSRGEKIPALKVLRKTAIEMGAVPENVVDVPDLFDEINDNEELSDLKRAIQIAFAEAQDGADENEAFKSLKRTIMEKFKISNPQWHKEDGFTAQISKAGLESLSYTIATKEDEIKWKAPSMNSWGGDWDASTLNDAIINALENL